MNTNRNFWPWGIVTAFALFFGGMTTVVVIASTHRDSLVGENCHEHGLKFQSQIDGAARAPKAGASIQRVVHRPWRGDSAGVFLSKKVAMSAPVVRLVGWPKSVMSAQFPWAFVCLPPC